MEEKESQARALLDKTNRQFNECNALYHAAAQRCGLSDAAFWTLYALVTSCEPLTQNRIAADWGIPKQTLNSAVAAMVKKGLLALCPGKGAHSGKIVTLTAEGRALVDKAIAIDKEAGAVLTILPRTTAGTDAAYAALSGKPVLEGLGLPGFGYHSDREEYVAIDAIPRRLYLAARLVMDLSQGR